MSHSDRTTTERVFATLLFRHREFRPPCAALRSRFRRCEPAPCGERLSARYRQHRADEAECHERRVQWERARSDPRRERCGSVCVALSGERGTGNGERGTWNVERGTGNGETGNGEREALKSSFG